jgi:hypothetical protein
MDRRKVTIFKNSEKKVLKKIFLPCFTLLYKKTTGFLRATVLERLFAVSLLFVKNFSIFNSQNQKNYSKSKKKY